MPSDDNNRYELFEKNPSFVSSRNDTEFGRENNSHSANNLGKRNNTSLQRGFINSPIFSNTYTTDQAKEKFQAYSGENLSFPMYRRNFIPEGSSIEIYNDVRNKETTVVGSKGLPATPFSPNVASPDVIGNVSSTDPLLISETVTALSNDFIRQKTTELNPKNVAYNSIDTTRAANVGNVRKFILGVGSMKGYGRSQ